MLLKKVLDIYKNVIYLKYYLRVNECFDLLPITVANLILLQNTKLMSQKKPSDFWL